ncbi:DNA-directed RNA polymerase subunit omega [Geminocystis sp. NIES-3708]|uniref:DNA-directed RNA polymerase subunit omega n=1 Tax=Geminocystis sp. NIES-3708 TaxID=1615909 RepID=UPI00082EE4DE|nr:DNA-directed RNA polymerase subunit omega [Geminocystis sp. NIES-3708]
MLKKNSFDSSQIMFRSDELMNAASNRYKITVAVAKRAKQRRKEDFENIEEVMKPVLRAIIEMSDELTQPEIISDD